MINSYFDEPTQEEKKREIAVNAAMKIIDLVIQRTEITKHKDFGNILDSIYDNIEHIADSIQDALENKQK